VQLHYRDSPFPPTVVWSAAREVGRLLRNCWACKEARSHHEERGHLPEWVQEKGQLTFCRWCGARAKSGRQYPKTGYEGGEVPAVLTMWSFSMIGPGGVKPFRGRREEDCEEEVRCDACGRGGHLAADCTHPGRLQPRGYLLEGKVKRDDRPASQGDQVRPTTSAGEGAAKEGGVAGLVGAMEEEDRRASGTAAWGDEVHPPAFDARDAEEEDQGGARGLSQSVCGKCWEEGHLEEVCPLYGRRSLCRRCAKAGWLGADCLGCGLTARCGVCLSLRHNTEECLVRSWGRGRSLRERLPQGEDNAATGGVSPSSAGGQGPLAKKRGRGKRGPTFGAGSRGPEGLPPPPGPMTEPPSGNHEEKEVGAAEE